MNTLPTVLVDIIMNYKKDLEWSGIIEKHRNNWYFISMKPLSEEFIREFEEKVDWVTISKHQTLSEEFIREFEEKHDW